MNTRTTWLLSATLLMLLVLSFVGFAQEPWTQYDFGGETIGISTRFPEMTPLGPRHAFNFLTPDARLQAHIEEVEEMFNVKIEFIPHPSEANVLSTFGPQILAGEGGLHIVDVDLTADSTNLLPMALQGYIQPLDDVLDSAYYESLSPLFRNTAAFQVDGRTYGFELGSFSVTPLLILWNKDMFEREGFPNLHELYAAGEWTWDVFEDLVLRATRDTTGDGEIDQFGVRFFWNFPRNVVNFAMTNNAQVTHTVDGRVEVAFTAPEFIEAIEFLQRIHQQQPGAMGTGIISNGQAAMAMGIPQALEYGEVVNADDAYSLVPLPRGPRAEEHVFPQWNRFMAVIPSTVEEPRAVIEVLNALRRITAPYMDVDLADWDDEVFWSNWGRFAQDRESLDVWQQALLHANLLENRGLMFQAGLEETVARLMNEGGNVAAALAEIEPVAQGMLDELYGQ